MIKIRNLKDLKPEEIKKLAERRYVTQEKEVMESVLNIINEVKTRGDKGLIELTEKFDKIKLEKNQIKVSEKEIEKAVELTNEKIITAIKTAAKNIEKFHKTQLPKSFKIETTEGVEIGQILRPLNSVGIYIPGGRFPLLSTVLMTAIPAKVAGIKSIVMCSPPRSEFNGIAPPVLVAANEVGVKEIYKVGGAQAIAAMAYGTEQVPVVDKIVGPGNIYVTKAKMAVRDDVLIDIPAGPSEVLVIADESSKPEFIAFDMISQAEHEPLAVSVLVSPSLKLAEDVLNSINELKARGEISDIAIEALKDNGLILVADSLDQCVDFANIFAPEHLEIMTEKPEEIMEKISNAGAIFLGEYSPVPLGDFAAGTNHVLPTGGFARKYSGLTVYDYLRFMSFVKASQKGLKNLKEAVLTLAKAEGLKGHADAVLARTK
ncbi:MAG: histidinol dehydrogenase [Candidatus Hodarchaeota archaeon]